MANLKFSSPAFDHESFIPEQYTCKGKNISPQLIWENIPEGTQSLALIMDDPDAPIGTFVHWVIYNIPFNTKELDANIPKGKIIKNIGTQGINSYRQNNYSGPCPPPGHPHRYYFKLYALDLHPELPMDLNKKSLMNKIQDHIIEESFLMGKFKR